jgi:hypothetical protein
VSRRTAIDYPTLAEPSDPEAYALYLQGLHVWNRRTAQTLRQAITLFEQAPAYLTSAIHTSPS